jgi:hypothetical protein
MFSFFSTHSKGLAARPLPSRTASIICGALFLTPLANVAFADANSAADSVLADSISQIQNLMVSMSLGCSGGPHGVPPVNWTALQSHGNNAVNALTAARLALAKGQTSVAVQQITFGEGELDTLVNGVHNNCSGGPSGEDPPGYAGYQTVRATTDGKLEVVKLFLGG